MDPDEDPEPECELRFRTWISLALIVLTHVLNSQVSRAKNIEGEVYPGEVVIIRVPPQQARIETIGPEQNQDLRGGYSKIESSVLLGANPIVVEFKNDDHLGKIEIPPAPRELVRQAFDVTSSLTQDERLQVQEMTDHILLGAAQVAKDDFSTLSEGKIKQENAVVTKERSTRRERMRLFLTFIRNSTIVSFIRASKDFARDFKQFKSNLNEFGFEVGFRFDLQIGVGRLAMTKNLPVRMRFGYNWIRRELIIESAIRKEKMADGFSVQGGARAEFRIYQRYTNVNAELQRTSEQKGQGWYPPGTPALPVLPALSFVWDKTSDYHSQGVSVGFNAADYVFQSYIMNTVNDYVESTRTVLRFSFSRRSSRVAGSSRLSPLWPPSLNPVCSMAFR